MKKFLENKAVGYYATFATALLSLLVAICYGVSVENNFALPLIFSILSCVSAVILLVKAIPLFDYVPFLTSSLTVGFLFYRLLNNLADIMAKNDMDGISAAFILALVFAVLSLASSIVALFAKREKAVQA